MASDGNIIQQAMERVEQLEDIKRGKYENTTSDSDSVLDEDADIIESEEDIPTEEEEDLKEEE
jgi:hypothetical protein